MMMVTDAFEHASEAFVSFNEEGEITAWNKMATELFGWSREEALGRQMISTLFPRDEQQKRYAAVNSYLATGREEELGVGRESVLALRKDGSQIELSLTIRVSQEIGDALTFNSLWSDQSEERRAREEERNAKILLESSQDSVLTVDSLGRVTSANASAQKWYGWSEDELMGKTLDDLTPGHLSGESEHLLARVLRGERVEGEETQRVMVSGVSHPITLTATPILGDRLEPIGATLIESDLEEAQHYQEQLEYLSDHDPLTGLHNRRRFQRETDERIEDGLDGAVVIFDVDHFKLINDAHGHEIGDRALSELACVLREIAREAEGEIEIAHFGRDEFALLLSDGDRSAARELASNCAKRISRELSGLTDRAITVSSGVVTWDSGDDRLSSSDDLLICADLALYSAKERGGGKTMLYQEGMMSGIQQAERLQSAMREDRLVLYAQPILNIQSGAIDQYELLLRVRDGEELLSPSGFLSAAERLGLIGAVDRWVLRQGIKLAGEGVRVEINLSGKSMTDPEIPVLIRDLIKEFDVNAEDLIFEITETTAIASMNEATGFAESLRELGCQFALDDFGTGFGSFTYLKHLPVSVLKIDGEFIRNLTQNQIDQKIVKAIVSVAHALGHKTVAEWVGDEECLAEVKRLGVDYAQGYQIGRPAELSAIPIGSRERSSVA